MTLLEPRSLRTSAAIADAAADRPPRTATEFRSRVSSSRLFATDARQATILIAEDHLDSRDALRALLEAVGYQVITAGNGAEAVEQALALRPDLILMDVMMPQVDGLEATRQLRAAGEFSGAPILALTAMEGAREKVFGAGFDDYLSKPIDIASLFAKVESWLNRPKQERDAE